MVTAIHAERGEFVSPGGPVVTVSGQSGLEVLLEVPESISARLQENSVVDVRLPLAGGSSDTLVGTIRRLGEATQGRAQLFPVLIALAPNPEVRAGMSADVTLLANESVGLSVPLAAIIDPSGLAPSLMRITTSGGIDSIERIEVRLGRLIGERVVVRGDIEVGDQVVTAGHAFLLDGDAVTVLNESAKESRIAREPVGGSL